MFLQYYNMKSKVETVLILPDVHLTVEENKVYNLVKNFIKSRKWDEIVILGDFLDFESLNPFDANKALKMENRRFLKEIDVANRELDFLQKYSNNIVYMEGNHERRAVWYVDKNPSMEEFINVPKNLKLKERKIKWIPYDNYSSYQKGHLTFIHGYWYNKYFAQTTLEKFGCNVVMGHTHRAQSAQMRMLKQKEYMAIGLGCLCSKDADFTRGPSSWINGFGVGYFSNGGNFNLYPINIINNKFIFEGKEWK